MQSTGRKAVTLMEAHRLFSRLPGAPLDDGLSVARLETRLSATARALKLRAACVDAVASRSPAAA
jgi:hypothetical protein